MEDTNWLLTDEFVAFSTKIAAIHEKKKILKSDLKKYFDKIKAEEKILDEEARQEEVKFQEWKNSQEKGDE